MRCGYSVVDCIKCPESRQKSCEIRIKYLSCCSANAKLITKLKELTEKFNKLTKK